MPGAFLARCPELVRVKRIEALWSRPRVTFSKMSSAHASASLCIVKGRLRCWITVYQENFEASRESRTVEIKSTGHESVQGMGYPKSSKTKTNLHYICKTKKPLIKEEKQQQLKLQFLDLKPKGHFYFAKSNVHFLSILFFFLFK